jgi:hypothetical protein
MARGEVEASLCTAAFHGRAASGNLTSSTLAGAASATNAAAIKVPKNTRADSINSFIAPFPDRHGCPALFQPSVRSEKVLPGQ